MVAKSVLGKALTIIYAVIFIPITTASVVFCGRFTTAVIKYFIISFESRLLKQDKVTRFERKIIAIQVALNIKFILLTSMFFHKTLLEHLTIFDSFYFIFISISTIGFGDIVYDIEGLTKLDALKQSIYLVVISVLFYTSFSLLAAIIGSCVSLGTDGSFKKFKIVKVLDSRGKTVKMLCENMVQMKPEEFMKAVRSHEGSEDSTRAIKTQAECGWDIQGDGERIQLTCKDDIYHT